MEKLVVEATTKTPLISFDRDAGELIIKGRSIPKDADAFWTPILNWFSDYTKSPAEKTTIQIDLEYFNISSSKSLLMLLYKLNDLKLKGFESQVEWFYNEDDIDMFEVGKDYAFMVKVPFEFKKQQSQELAMVV